MNKIFNTSKKGDRISKEKRALLGQHQVFSLWIVYSNWHRIVWILGS